MSRLNEPLTLQQLCADTLAGLSGLEVLNLLSTLGEVVLPMASRNALLVKILYALEHGHLQTSDVRHSVILEILSLLDAESDEERSVRLVAMEIGAKMLVRRWEFEPTTSDTGGVGIFPDALPTVTFDDEASNVYGRLSPAVICEILTHVKEDKRLRHLPAGQNEWPRESVPPAHSCPLTEVGGELINPDSRAWSMYLKRCYNGMALTYALTFANINSTVLFYKSSLVKLEMTSRPEWDHLTDVAETV